MERQKATEPAKCVGLPPRGADVGIRKVLFRSVQSATV
jgi:hypothetical protein